MWRLKIDREGRVRYYAGSEGTTREWRLLAKNAALLTLRQALMLAERCSDARSITIEKDEAYIVERKV